MSDINIMLSTDKKRHMNIQRKEIVCNFYKYEILENPTIVTH